MDRKLTAILSADVRGYSRLMGEDEEATVRTLTAYRQVITEAIHRNRGRVIDTPGDNVLADFASVVSAVRCAVEIQADLASRNEQLPESRRMEFRIGINLGDVIADGPRIYGDGVNVAARLEGLAAPGGIALSGAAFEQVEGKLSLAFDYGGEHAMKNIAKPVRVYHARMGPKAVPQAVATAPGRWRWHRRTVAATILALTVLVGASGLVVWLRDARRPLPAVAPVSFRADKPSLVVLPFTSLGGDARFEYMADGITHDLITDLSALPGLVMIASTTSFTYKRRTVDLEQVGRDLAVRYILQGSVQVAEEKVRVNAELTEVDTRRQLWAERYDRPIGEMLALQSAIAESIVARLSVTIADTERRKLLRRQTDSPRAYDAVLRGLEHLGRRTRSDTREARRLFQAAIQEDSSYAVAHALLAQTYWFDAQFGWTEFPDRALAHAEELAQTALTLDETSALARRMLGAVREKQGRFAEAIREYRAALAAEPNDAQSHKRMGAALVYAGRAREAIEWLEAARRLDPRGRDDEVMHLGLALFLTGRRREAITLLEGAAADDPAYTGHHVVLAASYAAEGRSEAARREAGLVRRQDPFFALSRYGTQFHDSHDRDELVEALRRAGLD